MGFAWKVLKPYCLVHCKKGVLLSAEQKALEISGALFAVEFHYNDINDTVDGQVEEIQTGFG